MKYENLAVQDSLIINNLVHVEVSATYHVLKPFVGAVVEGKVASRHKNNVDIEFEEYFLINSEVTAASEIKVGDHVTVKIKSLSYQDGMPKLQGSKVSRN